MSSYNGTVDEKREEKAASARDCEHLEVLYHHLMAAIEDTSRGYDALMQRVLITASFLTLALGTLMGEHAALFRESMFSCSGLLNFLSLGALLAMVTFIVTFWLAATPKKTRAVYAPSAVDTDRHKDACELYNQLVSDLKETLKKNKGLNSELGVLLSWLVTSALLALVLLGVLVVYTA